MAIQIFPLKYIFEVEKNNEFINRTVVFESGKKQKQRQNIKKLITWKISVRGDNNDRKALEQFHESVGGDATSFYFMDEDNVQQLVRFTDGKLNLLEKRDFIGNVIGFTGTLTLEKVI